ncbi:hypothetical protein NUW58_g5350 [Xylaria curta]|uniref:Uncharacterized protein n=1 Tax=Xylaria curta TaxID=42375 RepID=A0ACC1P4Z9_9PEZI|nr:hypothetical protein NUW58_g5350 [Xylaria curta]
MDEAKNIDYRGIGEGLSVARRRDSSLSESTISLSDDWQTLLRQRETPYSATSVAERTPDIQVADTAHEGSSALSLRDTQLVTLANGQHSQRNLTPLERYRFDVQTHEQLALGQKPDRRYLSEFNTSLDAPARLATESTPRDSASSCSILGSSSNGDTDVTPSLELNDLIRMKDSPGWQAVPPEEQANCLRRIAKLRRRFKQEGNPRSRKAVRVRKRSKRSDESNESLEPGYWVDLTAELPTISTLTSPPTSRKVPNHQHQHQIHHARSSESLRPRANARRRSTTLANATPVTRHKQLEYTVDSRAADVFFSLHCDGAEDPIYISEVGQRSMNFNFRFFDLSSAGPSVTRLSGVKIRVWAKRRASWCLLLSQNIDLRSLHYLGSLRNQHFAPNCLIFHLEDEMYSLDLPSKRPEPKQTLPLPSCSYNTLMKLSNLTILFRMH